MHTACLACPVFLIMYQIIWAYTNPATTFSVEGGLQRWSSSSFQWTMHAKQQSIKFVMVHTGYDFISKFSLLCSFPNALCTQLQVAHQSFIPAQRNPGVEQGSWGVLFCSNCAMFKIVTRPQRWVSCDLNTAFVVSLEKSSVNRCDIHDNIKATVWD